MERPPQPSLPQQLRPQPLPPQPQHYAERMQPQFRNQCAPEPAQQFVQQGQYGNQELLQHAPQHFDISESPQLFSPPGSPRADFGPEPPQFLGVQPLQHQVFSPVPVAPPMYAAEQWGEACSPSGSSVGGGRASFSGCASPSPDGASQAGNLGCYGGCFGGPHDGRGMGSYTPDSSCSIGQYGCAGDGGETQDAHPPIAVCGGGSGRGQGRSDLGGALQGGGPCGVKGAGLPSW